jgi:hypothetical protein
VANRSAPFNSHVHTSSGKAVKSIEAAANSLAAATLADSLWIDLFSDFIFWFQF